MKIIKKLCIPLFSLVLVLGCFAVSQMDASASSVSSGRFQCNFIIRNESGEVVARCSCLGYSGFVPSDCNICHHSYADHDGIHAGNEPLPAHHNHNYSTPDWGVWRKISSSRLLK